MFTYTIVVLSTWLWAARMGDSSNAWNTAKEISLQIHGCKETMASLVWLLHSPLWWRSPTMLWGSLWRGSHDKELTEVLGPKPLRGPRSWQQPHKGARTGCSPLDSLWMRPWPHPQLGWIPGRDRVRSTQICHIQFLVHRNCEVINFIVLSTEFGDNLLY